jgi:prophage antirepressor-like protein
MKNQTVPGNPIASDTLSVLSPSNVTVFQNPQFGRIRIVLRDGEPWFVANDVMEAFHASNRNRTMQTLTEDEKGYTQMSTPGGRQQAAVVSEAGLYALLFAMTPSKARSVSDEYIAMRCGQLRSFKRWITHEVLPSIRKHGVYAIDQLLDNPDLLIASLQKLKGERERANHAEELAAVQGRLIEDMQPKATYYDLVLSSVQYKLDGTWILYQEYADCGYTKTQTHAISDDKSVIHTCWTQKGRLFIYDLLKNERNLLPLIERDEETTASDVFDTPD